MIDVNLKKLANSKQMKSLLYPLLFEPVYKDYVWGGNRLSHVFERKGVPPVCAESWELTDRPEGMSIVINGALKGKTLRELVENFGTELTGTDSSGGAFPLLIKLIDARKDLSVQVHPDAAIASLVGGEPKTEMWYMLEATPSALVYAGLKPGVTSTRFIKALEENRLEHDVLAAVPARPGRAFFVPGGRPHAIGAGCLLLEIQQNSNTTYRIYDWNRTDEQGRHRELHLEKALQAIDWEKAQPDVRTPQPASCSGPNSHASIIDCQFFQTKRMVLNAPETFTHEGKRFHVIFVIRGDVLAGTNGTVASVGKGTTCLLPAATRNYTLSPLGGPATLIHISG